MKFSQLCALYGHYYYYYFGGRVRSSSHQTCCIYSSAHHNSAFSLFAFIRFYFHFFFAFKFVSCFHFRLHNSICVGQFVRSCANLLCLSPLTLCNCWLQSEKQINISRVDICIWPTKFRYLYFQQFIHLHFGQLAIGRCTN